MEDYKVRCNMCEWIGEEEDLEFFKEDETDMEGFKGCPNCETDSYLMDIENTKGGNQND